MATGNCRRAGKVGKRGKPDNLEQHFALDSKNRTVADDIDLLLDTADQSYSLYKTAGPDLKVTPERLSEVSRELRKLGDSYDEHISGIAREVRRLVNHVNAEFDETYVRSASYEVWQEVKLMEDLYRQIR